MVRRILVAVAATSLAATALLTPPPTLSVELEVPTYFVGQPGWDYAPGSQCADPDYWTDGDWTGGGAYNSDNDAIQDAADNAASGSIIHICTGTYNFAEEVTVAAGKSLTFQGDGEEETTLDGNDITRIFNANPSQSNDQGGVLGISDLIIMDAEVEAADNKNGAAVYADGLVLTNVTITRSWDAYNGGALYAEGDVSIARSTFTDNVARYDGGALYAWNVNRTVTISDSVFESNGAGDNAAAVMAAGDMVILRSQILDNAATNVVGAVWAGSDLEVRDSTFEGNESTNSAAGAIRAIGAGAIVEIDGSTFTQNVAFDFGGALVMQNLASLTIRNSQFVQNVSEIGFGGAMNLYNIAAVTISNSRFYENEARGGNYFGNGNGGAIDACNVASFTSTGSEYLGNESTQFGGAIGLFGVSCDAPGSVVLRGNLFSHNTATNDGGALWVSGTLTTMIGNVFTNNHSGGAGGAVYGGWWDGGELRSESIIGNRFIENHAVDAGGALWIPGDLGEVSRNLFRANSTEGSGGAVVLTGAETEVVRSVHANQFLRNTADVRGGAFYLQCSSVARSVQSRLVSANRLKGNRAFGDRRTSQIYLANLC